MKKNLLKYILASCLLFPAQGVMAQDCSIPISVVIDNGFAHVMDETASTLKTQLERLVTQSKLDVGWDNANFAVTAKFDQLDRHVQGGAPAQIVNVFGVTLYLVDIYHQKLFSSAYVEVKGVGTNDTKASMNAVRQLNRGNTKITSFLSGLKQRIINYYDSQLPIIMKEVKSKVAMKNYGEALAMLAVVPTCCNGYDSAMKEAMRIYEIGRAHV